MGVQVTRDTLNEHLRVVTYRVVVAAEDLHDILGAMKDLWCGAPNQFVPEDFLKLQTEGESTVSDIPPVTVGPAPAGAITDDIGDFFFGDGYTPAEPFPT